MSSKNFSLRPVVFGEESRRSRLKTPLLVGASVCIAMGLILSSVLPAVEVLLIVVTLFILPLVAACFGWVMLRFELSEEFSKIWGHPLTIRQLKMVRMTDDENTDTEVFAKPLNKFLDNVLAPSRARGSFKRYFRKKVQGQLVFMSLRWKNLTNSLSFTSHNHVQEYLVFIHGTVDDIVKNVRDIKAFKHRLRDARTNPKLRLVVRDGWMIGMLTDIFNVDVEAWSDKVLTDEYIPLWQGYATLILDMLRNIMEYRTTLQASRTAALMALSNTDVTLTNTHLELVKLYIQVDITEQQHLRTPEWLRTLLERFASQNLSEDTPEADRERLTQSIRKKLETPDVNWMAEVLNHRNFKIRDHKLSVKDMQFVFHVE